MVFLQQANQQVQLNMQSSSDSTLKDGTSRACSSEVYFDVIFVINVRSLGNFSLHSLNCLFRKCHVVLYMTQFQMGLRMDGPNQSLCRNCQWFSLLFIKFHCTCIVCCNLMGVLSHWQGTCPYAYNIAHRDLLFFCCCF